MNFGYLLAFVLLCCSFVSAQTAQEFPNTSGNAFVRLCSSIDKEDQAHLDLLHEMACIGYVAGIVQGVNEEIDYAHAMTNKKPPAPFCIPDEVENGQIVKIVLKHINDHPAEAHEKTAVIILRALRASFPCR